MDLKSAAELAALKAAFENDLAPYTDVFELLASLEKNTSNQKNKLGINLTSKHPELENAKEDYTTDWTDPEGTIARVTKLYAMVLERVKGIHGVLEKAGIAKPVEKTAEAE